jgi:hypothetical protein
MEPALEGEGPADVVVEVLDGGEHGVSRKMLADNGGECIGFGGELESLWPNGFSGNVMSGRRSGGSIGVPAHRAGLVDPSV